MKFKVSQELTISRFTSQNEVFVAKIDVRAHPRLFRKISYAEYPNRK